jgi:glycosyltransferase involved in cell wall biosynthesis
LSKHFSYGHGGTPEALLLMARALRALDFACDVRCPAGFFKDVGSYDDLPPSGTQGSRHFFYRIADYSALLVVGAWNPIALPMAIAARSAGVIVLYAPKGQLCRFEFQRLRDAKKLFYLALIEIWIALLAKKILFTSALELDRTLLPPILCRKRACVLPEPLDGDRLGRGERARRKNGAPFHFGFIGQASARKGVAELVDGFLLATQNRPEVPVVLSIAGSTVPAFQDTFDAIRRRSEIHPEGWRIRFLGQIFGEERLAFYNNIDFLIMPSHFESYGLVLLEALWHGCAAITGRDVGVLEYLSNRDGITVLPEISPAAIAHTIGSVLDDPQRLILPALTRRHIVPDRLRGESVADNFLRFLA